MKCFTPRNLCEEYLALVVSHFEATLSPQGYPEVHHVR